MGVPYADLGRSFGPRRIREASSSSRFSHYATISDLVALHAAARDMRFAGRGRTQSLLPARADRRSNGAPANLGLEARSLSTLPAPRRPRAPSSDGLPAPVLIVVDQRLSMFFGSRRSLKSVAAAEAAALCVWRGLDFGAAVGGVVFNDSTVEPVEPRLGGGAAMQLVRTIATKNGELRAGSPQPRAPKQLEAALRSKLLARAGGCNIVVVSDFEGHCASTRELLREIGSQNQVLAVCVYDPFLLDLSRAGDIIVTGGEVQIDLEFGDGLVRRRLFDLADAQASQALAVERELGVPVYAVSAAEDTPPQMRGLLDALCARPDERD
ncbi:DUF58 domain-containing protein [Methylocella sp.]|uniref:DUF58 domain-containing protein n=1 Tax=Methylocella sp. TaxID=1978226 RepID=UPI0037837D5D